VRFDRFSPYHDERERYGLELRPVDWYALTYPFPPEALENLAYYFADHDYAAPYAFNVARMLGKLRAAVDRWIARWEEGPPPELRLDRRGDTAYVFDSRSGAPVEYPLDPAALRVLEALSAARKPAALAGELEGIDVEAQVAALAARGLVFHEGERWMSLVVPPPTPFAIPLPRMETAAAAA
jgi:magnesium-protoporphyrin IX monomethyl ester (oxidative) cyclase